jgi:hypothetical protein
LTIIPIKTPEVSGNSAHIEDNRYTLAVSASGLVQGIGIRMWIYGHLDIWGDGRATVKCEDGPYAEPPGALDL